MKTFAAAALLLAGLTVAACEGGSMRTSRSQGGYTVEVERTGPENDRLGVVRLGRDLTDMERNRQPASASNLSYDRGGASEIARVEGVTRLEAVFTGARAVRVCAEGRNATVQTEAQVNGETFTVARSCEAG